MPVFPSVDYWDQLLSDQRQAEEDDARIKGYKQRWSYYHGDHAKQLATRAGEPDDNVDINLVRVIVDKGASFLFGKDLPMELQEGETTPEEELLDRTWQRNRKMTWLGKLGVAGGIFGHAFVKIVPDGIEPGVARLISIDPEYVEVLWDDEDIDCVLAYDIQWQTRDDQGRVFRRRQVIYPDEEQPNWHIDHYVDKPAGRWRSDPENPDMTWGWPFAPIIDCQNIPLPGAYYGLSDVGDMALQDGVNLLASLSQRILRYHAYPKTYGAGFRAEDFRFSPNDVTIFQSPEAWIKNLEMQSDLGALQELLRLFISWDLGTNRVPRIDPAVINVGALSGFALRILYGDLLEKTETKRRTYGDMLVELCRRLLSVAGMGDDHYVTLHWSDPLPEDTRQMTDLAQFQVENELVSKETLREQMGLDHETETERLEAEEAASGNIGAALVRNFLGQTGTAPGARVEEEE